MIVLKLDEKPCKDKLVIQQDQDPRIVIYNEAVAKGYTGTFEEFFGQLFRDKANILDQADW